MYTVEVDSVSYKSVRKDYLGKEILEPSICVFTPASPDDVSDNVFEIVALNVNSAEGTAELICLAPDEKDPESVEEINVTLPLSYVTLVTAFSLNPNPLNFEFFPDTVKDAEILDPEDKLFSLTLGNSLDDALNVSEQLISVTETMRTMPMIPNAKNVYTGHYAQARGKLFVAISDMALGHTSGAMSLFKYLPHLENYLARKDDETIPEPEELLAENLKAHDTFIEALLFFLDYAYDKSVEDDYFMDEDEGDIVQSTPVPNEQNNDSEFFKIMDNSGIKEILDKAETRYSEGLSSGTSTRTMRMKMTYPFTPDIPSSLLPLFTYITVLDNDASESYGKALKMIEDGDIDSNPLSLSDTETVKENFLAKALIIAARALRCQDNINTFISTSSPDEGFHPVTSSFLVNDFLSDYAPEEESWVLNSLRDNMINYDLDIVKDILSSTTNLVFAPLHLVFLNDYMKEVIKTLMSHSISPDDFTRIMSRSEIKGERQENSVVMVSDFYKTFCMNIREKINNSGHNTDTEAVEVSIEEPYIEEYILDFIENLIFEASEDDVLTNVQGESPTYIEDFANEMAYQFSYVIPILADYIAEGQNNSDSRFVGSDEWRKVREQFANSLEF